MPGFGIKRAPSRMTLSNTLTGDDLEAQFNPTEFHEKIAANWNELAVLGLSHMPQQYQQTGNYKFSIELAFRARDDNGDRLDDIAFARRFLMHLLYPSRGESDVPGGSPPRVLFFWPKLVHLTAIVNSLDLTHTLFNVEGDPIHFSAKLELSEIRDTRLYSEDVLEQGTIRSSGGGLV